VVFIYVTASIFPYPNSLATVNKKLLSLFKEAVFYVLRAQLRNEHNILLIRLQLISGKHNDNYFGTQSHRAKLIKRHEMLQKVSKTRSAHIHIKNKNTQIYKKNSPPRMHFPKIIFPFVAQV